MFISKKFTQIAAAAGLSALAAGCTMTPREQRDLSTALRITAEILDPPRRVYHQPRYRIMNCFNPYTGTIFRHRSYNGRCPRF